MNNSPMISIIVPVYNVEKYLAKCLDSIINQTYGNIEVICVNDGSPDGSRDILAQYASRDSRIIVIDQENQGLSGARNTALKNVHGKYIIFVDSDDFIELDTCEKAIKTAEENNADLVFWSYVREFGNVSKEKHFFWDDGTVFEENEVKNQLHRRLCGLSGEELSHPDYANAFEPVWNKLYRADYIINNNVFFVDTKEIGTEDALFNLYAIGHVKKAVYINECLYHYLKTNNGSLTSTYKKNLYVQWKNLFDKMRTYIVENNLSQTYYDALDNRIALSLIGLGLNIVSADFGYFKKISLIKEILSSEDYKKAYKKLEYKYFPIHWKIFFLCAKHRLSWCVYFILLCMKTLINKR